MEAAEIDHMLRAIAGLLLELADRGGLDRLPGGLVADQARRQLDAAGADRHPILLDEDHIPLVDRQDHRRGDVAGAGDIFPRPLLGDPDIFAFPDGLRRIVAFAHSSIKRSGSSLGFTCCGGRHRASTSPIFSTARAMPSPGRPAFTSSIKAAIASPHTLGSTFEWIASSATISARRSSSDR